MSLKTKLSLPASGFMRVGEVLGSAIGLRCVLDTVKRELDMTATDMGGGAAADRGGEAAP